MRVTTKGQVTIPQEIREKMGITPAVEVDFLEEKGRIYLVARDVSNIGHWGVGDVELAVNSLNRLEGAEPFIQGSFENAMRK